MPMVASDQLYWADGDRFAFAWEQTGWLHLYSVSAEGGPATQLTPGNFEIEHVSLSENRRELLLSSNQDDIDRRHIWRVPVAGGGATQPILGGLGEGIEWEPEDLGNGAVAYFRSSPKDIGRAVVKMANGGPRDMAPDSIPADFPSNELVTPQQVIFSASDGMQIHGQLFLPKGERETSGDCVFPRRLPAADAARVALHVLLLERAAIALPFLDAMVPAFAGPTKAVRRLGVVYVPNGVIIINGRLLRPVKTSPSRAS